MSDFGLRFHYNAHEGGHTRDEDCEEEIAFH